MMPKITKPSSSNDKIDFGFQEVKVSEKTSKVQAIFSQVASKYDLMNDLMSLGIHRLWKETFIEKISLVNNAIILDVAGGTGDIGYRCARSLLNRDLKGRVIVLDLNEAMLRKGQRKENLSSADVSMDWVLSNAEQLPLPDNTFDVYTIAFGLRNITHLNAALQEAYRVLKPGGQFLCLEFSKVRAPLLKKFYDLYSFKIIPFIGKLIANNKNAYQYLVESIARFPSQEELSASLKAIGFEHVKYTNLSGGIATIHTGWKI